MNFHFSGWDVALVVMVSLQATSVAYLHAPKWKALVLSLPVPSTLAILALGQPVNTTYVAGLGLLILFTHGVRWLHCDRGVAIVPAIAVAAVVYCTIGAALAPIIPTTPQAFWIGLALVMLVALAIFGLTRHRDEPGHRSPLPVWIKLPIVAGIVIALVLMKKLLLGFMAFYPMVGTITAYEARHSLWTISRQVTAFIVAMGLMLAAVRLTQEPFGLGAALALGWGVLLTVLAALTWAQHRWKRAQLEIEDD